jgi:6-phospho-beta-glucosidase
VKVLTVLGGGSAWTPHLLRSFARIQCCHEVEVRLYGPTQTHLEKVAAFVGTTTQPSLNVQAVSDLGAALRGADVIINQARIGGWDARHGDEFLPSQLGELGDESLGLGSLRAALRNWAFVAETAPLIRAEAPGAWLLNLANPCDLVSRSWHEAGCSRVIGICEHAQMRARQLAEEGGYPEAFSRLQYVGMSHVGWLVPYRDSDVQPILRRFPELSPWFRGWGALPTTWRMAMHEPAASACGPLSPGSRARQLSELTSRLRVVIGALDLCLYEELIRARTPVWYEEMVVPALDALLGGRARRLILGLPNRGFIPEVEESVYLENWATLDSGAFHRDPPPSNTACRADVAAFAKARDLAFLAMMRPTIDALNEYAETDPYVRSRPTVSQWRALLRQGAGNGILE